MSFIYSPLRYPGGKNCIFPFVSKIFYENNLIGFSYAEPYAGGSGLALRLLFEGYVKQVYINDLDFAIYSFWHSVLHRTEELCNWIEDVEITLTNWRTFKEIHSNQNQVDSFELAKATFFLNRTNISGVIKGGAIGGITQKGKYKIDARFNKKDLIKRIRRIAELKERIFISNLDGLTFTAKMDKKKEPIFIYLDPPYYQKGGELYMNFYSKEDHRKLSKYVTKLKKDWMVSYDNHQFILNLYSQHNKIMYKLSQSASNRVGDEILVFAPSLHFNESIQNLKEPILL